MDHPNYSSRISEQDARQAYQNYHVDSGRVDFQGPAPEWSDLGCRGCWAQIPGGHPAVDTGYAAWHNECYDRVKEIGSKPPTS